MTTQSLKYIAAVCQRKEMSNSLFLISLKVKSITFERTVLPEELLHLSQSVKISVCHDCAIDGLPKVGRNGSNIGQMIGKTLPVKQISFQKFQELKFEIKTAVLNLFIMTCPLRK